MKPPSTREIVIGIGGLVLGGILTTVGKVNPDRRTDVHFGEIRSQYHRLFGSENGKTIFEKGKEKWDATPESTFEVAHAATGEFLGALAVFDKKEGQTVEIARVVNEKAKIAYLHLSRSWFLYPGRREKLLPLKEQILQGLMRARSSTRALPASQQNTETSTWAEEHGMRWTALHHLFTGNQSSYEGALTDRVRLLLQESDVKKTE